MSILGDIPRSPLPPPPCTPSQRPVPIRPDLSLFPQDLSLGPQACPYLRRVCPYRLGSVPNDRRPVPTPEGLSLMAGEPSEWTPDGAGAKPAAGRADRSAACGTTGPVPGLLQTGHPAPVPAGTM